MSVEGLEMLRKHMAYYDFAPDSVLLLGNVLYYAKKAEAEVAELEADNAKLRKLALGLKWCSENYGCENVCPLYDKSEPEHCREERLLRELGIEVG